MFPGGDSQLFNFGGPERNEGGDPGEELQNETHRRLINFPTSLNANFARPVLDFQKIEPSYFLTNDLSRRPAGGEAAWEKEEEGGPREEITFEKEVDEEREHKKRITLFDLSEEQKEKVKHFKIKKVLQNEVYLKKNKILKYLVHMFVCDLLREKPDDIYEFAACYFTHPQLRQSVARRLRGMIGGP
ncbi:conserved Plasmodium protein, unknown function [Plasmodium vivax]|uniref:RIIa domain-containing protein n=6 Tax=Plasmodium vivax TaxID=5855 RepID=A5K0Z2_PLAVS|nr:hypothetical protein, conserved [Plasmodium vivax]KMZ78593.1 hypothetical protein PVIIG_01370 [Plasmodium vivax India VII]KMZ83781.1 hypothetical protein PVBG_00861 [Plasmodium vivax Brazil I]KMZ90617.1 hypothetical protein PVMG_02786 [Plasmodium vivax Mauritania I]KMZ97523.1 hypothetical protein PVNG_03957 [Plasmodium vivax North Korean]EDL46989.1 hypothetical protein, conserved [Plasmodium vivax]|eukprot:XP_001616716.1 hypothetical protein [Plasmodium vivax Sal-1]